MIYILATTGFLLATLALPLAFAQDTSTMSFKTYRNATLGFSILYPSEWQTGVNTMDGENQISFTSPENNIPLFYVHVKEVPSYLDTNTMTVKNRTLEQIVQDHLDLIGKPNSLGLESKLIRQNQFNFGNNAGWKIELFIGPKNEPNYYAYEVLTIANGKLYSLYYTERPLIVPQTLPIVNKVVESFHILTTDEKYIIVKPQPPTQPGYHSKISPLIDNGTLGYKTLFDRTTNPKKFSPELQTLINSTCDKVRSDYSSFGSIDRNWFLANC